MLEDTDSEMLYQNAMTFEGEVELNMQFGLAPVDLRDWFRTFTTPTFRPSCADYGANLPCFPMLLERRYLAFRQAAAGGRGAGSPVVPPFLIADSTPVL
jgi:hypothetical protein